jgi:hypothetical protein
MTAGEPRMRCLKVLMPCIGDHRACILCV